MLRDYIQLTIVFLCYEWIIYRSIENVKVDRCNHKIYLLFMHQYVIIKIVKAGGGLAQLGEHLHGMQGVTSSSLVSSTIFIVMVVQLA